MIIKEMFVINNEFLNTRIDKWLKHKMGKIPQSFLEKSLRSGKIKVNNNKMKPCTLPNIQDVCLNKKFGNKCF